MNNIKGSLPNALTFINMSLGILAILMAVNGGTNEIESINLLMSASLLVLVAALTDRIDGKVARALGVASELGKELDSLSDLISFGVAPIIIAWKVSFMDLGTIGYIITLIFPMAGAYRLARYNVTKFDDFFRGIPITVAGAFLSIVSIYNCLAVQNNKFNNFHIYLTIVLVLLLSFLMVSKIKIKKM